jgi:hypothetical protein
MTDEERKRAAQALLDMPLFNQLWDELETAAVDRCINAKPNDDETRRVMASEARVIRLFRDRIRSLAQSAVEGKKAPA